MNKRLYLSEDEVFGGVCGGLAEHFGIDPVFIRVPLFLLAVYYGIGLVLYLAFWLAMPHKD
jgi:phage shock protein C